MSPTVVPQLLATPAVGVLSDVAEDPDRWAIEPKVGAAKGLGP